jgi:hypothetical protein
LSAPKPLSGSGPRVAATFLRAVFICLMIVVTLRVAAPQSETIWTADDTPSDLIRVLLGVAVSVFLAVQLFRGPKDASGYRTWLYLGVAAVPLGLALLIVVW